VPFDVLQRLIGLLVAVRAFAGRGGFRLVLRWGWLASLYEFRPFSARSGLAVAAGAVIAGTGSGIGLVFVIVEHGAAFS
jgi:hypothetical protein